MSRKIFFILVFVFLLILIILATFVFHYLKNKVEKEETTSIKKERVELQTDDGVYIIGNFYYNPDSKFSGILIHSLGSNKERFEKLAKYLSKYYSVLAIDLRGNGESINSVSGKRDWKNEDCKNYIYDILCASKFLESKGFKTSNQFLIGEGEGANISLKFLTINKDIKADVLLFPKENYCGISLEKYINNEIGGKISVISGKNAVLDIFKKQATSSSILIYKEEAKNKIFDFKEINDKIKMFLIEHLI
jgi:hypothetical protein